MKLEFNSENAREVAAVRAALDVLEGAPAMPLDTPRTRGELDDDAGNGSADTATGQDGGQDNGTSGDAGDASTTDAADAADERVDMHGVKFDPEFCGEASDPFYGSGKRQGQWKKRRGVDEQAYDSWYAAQRTEQRFPPLKPAGEAEESEQEQEQVSTAAAFGAQDNTGGSDPAQAAAAAPPPPATAAQGAIKPTTSGELMVWAANQQAAGVLTQDDINAAYAEAGFGVADIFPPVPPETVRARVEALFDILTAKVAEHG